MKTNIEIEFCIQQDILCSSEMHCHLLASLAQYVSSFLARGGPGGRAY